MLQVQFIRDHKKTVLEGLAKRNFPNAEEMIEQVLAADETRRKTQVSLDNTLAESNKLSKEIGMLFKSGEVQKANLVKEKTGQLKETTNQLKQEFNLGYQMYSTRMQAASLFNLNKQWDKLSQEEKTWIVKRSH